VRLLVGGCLLAAVLVAGALPLSTAQADARPDMARVVTQDARPAECISRVAIRRIDGRERFVPARGFDLAPGRHTMTGTVELDTRHCPVPQGRNITGAVPPLDENFEAGKTYYVGFDHSAEDSAEWKLVVWKVE
jgi:hypothetical protein